MHSLGVGITATLLITSCVQELDSPATSGTAGNETLATFDVSVTGITAATSRAALTGAQEASVTKLCALVFDHTGKYQYRAFVKQHTDNSVTLKMKVSESPSDTYDVAFIANVDTVNNLALLKEGMSKSDVQQALLFGTPNGYDIADGTLPLWGESVPFTIVPGKNNLVAAPVELMRAVARIDLKMATPLGSDYKLTKVYLYNNRTTGYLIPASLEGSTVTTPSVPDHAGVNTDGVDYSGSITGDSLVRSLYVPENEAMGKDGKTPTLLVAGISYKGNAPSYYRLDLQPTNDNAKHWDVLRNHKYTLLIKQFTGEGWGTPEKAASSDPWNVQWTVKMDDQTNTGGYVSGGYYFKTQKEITLSGELSLASHAKSVTYYTNVSSFSDADIRRVETAANSNYPVTATVDTQRHLITFTAEANNDTDDVIETLFNVTVSPIETFQLIVRQDKAREHYEITDAKVHGLYLPDMKYTAPARTDRHPLITGVHYMTVTVRTMKHDDYRHLEKFRYNIHTNIVNNYSFSAEGSFAKDATWTKDEGNYTYFEIRLNPDANSRPINSGYNFFTIATEGQMLGSDQPSVYAKQVRVLVGYRAKTFVTFASYDGYYGYAGSAGPSWSKKMLDEPTNFGLNGTVPIEALVRQWIKTSTPAGEVMTTTEHPFIKALSTDPIPDIAILGFDFRFSTAETGAAVRNYINKGGVVIMFTDYLTPSYAADNVKQAWGDIAGSLSVSAAGGPGTMYGMPSQGGTEPTPTDKDYIMNGLFGALWSKSWGEDASTTTAVKGADLGKVVVYTGTGNTYSTSGAVTIFRSRDKGILFVGDGGFLSRGDNVVSTTICPFYLSNKKPAVNPYYASGGAYNSLFFANAMHWAIDYAEFHGPNNIVSNDDYSSWEK